jgi:small subunit ribosomal protein S6
MVRYELLMLTLPELTTDESVMLESQIEQILKENRAELISYERWGKFKLAYPIRNYDYGVYFLVRFSCASVSKASLLSAIKVFCMVKHTDLIMRHMVHILPSTGSLEYYRPESLEEAPSRSVDAFLKENKMTGLLGKSEEADVAATPTQQEAV